MTMRKINKLITIAILLLMSNAVLAQSPAATKKSTDHQQATTPAPSAVSGSGTVGQLTKWTGVQGASTYTLGDSLIFEDKFGKIGIGTKAPTSPLTVQGMIETTLGGYKFPDGTVQTTAGLSSIIHDSTLAGNGTNVSPLKVAVPLLLKGAGETLRVEHTQAGVAITGISKPFGIYAPGVGVMGITGTPPETGYSGAAVVGLAGGDFVYGVRGDVTGFMTTGVKGDAIGMFSTGVSGQSDVGNGISGASTSGKAGVFGGKVDIYTNGSNPGNLSVAGTLSKGAGSFKIDHPLDPENKYLYHSFVESPDMKNIYDGVAKLDTNGEAIIELPDWFGALNRDYRYLLTAIGTPAPALFIAEEIRDNRFKIGGGIPGMKVSWQVTGIRQDAFANKNRIPVEEDKPETERGTYLHPAEHGQPDEKSLVMVQHPELMRQMKEAREKARKGKLQ
jgi:hypothetical protein